MLEGSDRPIPREAPRDPTPGPAPTGSLRFADIRLSDIQAGGTYPELVNLLMENGFDLEFEYLPEGRLSLTVERCEESVDPEKLRAGAAFSTIEPGLARVNPSKASDATTGPPGFHHLRDAGLFSYTLGILGAAAFMTLAIGPGWMGFFAGFIPASALAAWAVSGHA